MKIEKIDIQTSNKKHATDIAILVDKFDFLQKLDRLRNKWKLTSFFDTSNIDGFFALNIHTKNANPKEARQRFIEFNDDIDKLLRRFHRGRNFKKVIEYALATGVVPEGIYQSCYFDTVTINEQEDRSKPEKYQYAIIMSPRTEKKEVVQAFSEFEKHIRGYEPRNDFVPSVLGKIQFDSSNKWNSEIPTDRELIDQFHNGNIYPATDITKFKTQKELDRTREWYWIRNKKYFNKETSKPLSYPEILDEWLDSCPFHKEGKQHDLNDPDCPKCTFLTKKKRKDKRVKEGGGSYNHIQQALDSYNNLLNNS